MEALLETLGLGCYLEDLPPGRRFRTVGRTVTEADIVTFVNTIGMTEVQGDFVRGDVIAVRSEAGDEIARGLANYSAAEARLIARRASSQIESLLGYANEPEMIHRDNLVLA